MAAWSGGVDGWKFPKFDLLYSMDEIQLGMHNPFKTLKVAVSIAIPLFEGVGESLITGLRIVLDWDHQ